MPVSVVLFTRDLRLHDNPTLHTAAVSSSRVLPLFVLDDAILSGDFNRPNRAAFLTDCLRDLDQSLRGRDSGLVIRRGDVVEETVRAAREIGAEEVHVAADVSSYAHRRERRLARQLASVGIGLVRHEDTSFVVPPGLLTPAGRDHMAVFSPYFRRWERMPVRAALPAPRRLQLPTPPPTKGRVPAAGRICPGTPAADLPPGGETAGRWRLSRWLATGLASYDDHHDALADDATSRLSPYLHFGCLSPHEVVRRARERPSIGSDAFVRQVAWRDFNAQVLAARPDAVRVDYRPRGDRWHHDLEELAAWQEGRTGYPVVDAAMRQLRREGWMHNRARLIAAHFLCKTLYVDWRLGAQHFIDHLVDGDTANNTMNWQWVAGTGTDSRFNRTYNVVLQARRHDPHGAYVRRYVEELAEVDDAFVHVPWRLPDGQRAALGYPAPIVDQDEARERLRRGRHLRGAAGR